MSCCSVRRAPGGADATRRVGASRQLAVALAAAAVLSACGGDALVGVGCVESSECKSGLVCHAGACRVPPGGQCTESTECAAPALCEEGQCRVPGGGNCSRGEPCVAGYTCEADECRGAIGSPCAEGVSCQVALACLAFTCRVPLGGPCSASADCEDGAECDTGLCRMRVGRACATSSECRAGALCEANVCRAPKNGSCTETADCASGLQCEAEICRVPVGGACEVTTDCVPGLGCGIDRTCRVPKNGACTATDQCDGDLVCDNGFCRIGVLAPCGENECASGLSCVESHCLVGPGGPCPGRVECGLRLVCEAGACRPEMGAPCDVVAAEPNRCAAGLVCEQDVCVGGLLAGCLRPGDCGAGLVCSLEQCRRVYDGACSADAQCAAGYVCDDGRCRVRALRPCGDELCAKGLFCADGVCRAVPDGACPAGDECADGYECREGRCREVTPPSGLAYADNPASYVAGLPIRPNTPTVQGDPVQRYAVEPALPAGLVLDAGEGVISGTPTAVTPTQRYTVTATNRGGSASVVLTIAVTDPPPRTLSYSTNPATYTRGVRIAPNLAIYAGGAATFSVEPPLPAGLSLDALEGTVSGVPLALAARDSYVVTARNSGGAVSTTLVLEVKDVAPSNLLYSENPAIYTAGRQIPENVPSNSGGVITHYAVTPELPPGLDLDPVTGIISGTPLLVSASNDYEITGTNSGGQVRAVVTLAVHDVPPSNLGYSRNPAVYTKGVSISANRPQYSGGRIVSFRSQPALPAGLLLDEVTGAVTGTPAAVSPARTYTIIGTNSGGTATADLRITVNDRVPAPFRYALDPARYVIGGAIEPNRPVALDEGGTVLQYTVAPELPAGLALDPATGDITGTPLVLAPERTYTVTAHNSGGATEARLDVAVLPQLRVEPVFPRNGAKWNDMVAWDDPARPAYLQTDSPCGGAEQRYSACVNGGELRKVAVGGVPSCAGLSLVERLGAFDWTCDDSGGTATFFTRGLKQGRRLGDLLEAGGWKANSVRVAAGDLVLETTPEAWWTNPVRSLADAAFDNSGPAAAVLALGTAGAVYVVPESRATQGYSIEADRVAVVTLGDAVLRYAGGSAFNCHATSGKTANANSRCVLAGGTLQFGWIEGRFEARSEGTVHADFAVLLGGTTRQTRVSDTVVSGARTAGLYLSGAACLVTRSAGVDNGGCAVWLPDNVGAGAPMSERHHLEDLSAVGNGFCGLDGGALAIGGSAHTLLRLEATRNTKAGVMLNQLAASTVEDIRARGNGTGVYLKTVKDTRLTGVVASGNVGDGIDGYGSQYSRNTNVVLERATASGNGANGVGMGATTNCRFVDVTASNNVGSGFLLSISGGDVLVDVSATGNGGAGFTFGSATATLLRVTASSNGTHGLANTSPTANPGPIVVSGLVAANNRQSGVALTRPDIALAQVVASGNGGTGISLAGRSRLVGAVSVNNGGGGVELRSESVAANVVAANNGASGVDVSSSSDVTVSRLAALHNGTFGVSASASTNLAFVRRLVVGGNASLPCSMTGGTPGLVHQTCTTEGTEGSSTYPAGSFSSAVLRLAPTLAGAFVGQVLQDDARNASDTQGAATYPANPAAFDFARFAAPWRAWGRDTTEPFPHAAQRGQWSYGAGRIWDWGLRATDARLRGAATDEAAAAAFVADAACPADASGDAFVQGRPYAFSTTNFAWRLNGVEVSGNGNGACDAAGDQCAQRFLASAVELVDDAVGDDDALCESGEACLYTPNLGAYQGHGQLGACAFRSGAVSGVTLFGHPTNGY